MSQHDEEAHFARKYYAEDRKSFRKERRIASLKDRSKFKKSDQDQRKKRAEETPSEEMAHDLLKGRVLKISQEGIDVDCAGTLYVCSLRGALKKEKNRAKSLVAVGDFVRIQPIEGSLEATIVLVEERRSVLSRADNLSRLQEQLIAVNVDQVLITASVLSPPLKPPLLDRYIIAAQKGNMTPILVINKIDLFVTPPPGCDPLLLSTEKTIYEELVRTYTVLEIAIFPVSTATGEGLAALKKAMQGKTSVVSGQSGVGKSSLINWITGISLPTGTVVQKTGKGSHTTSTTHLIPLEGGGFCIDTPGIKSFGLWDLKKEQVEEFFSEIQEEGTHCKFPDCHHLSEPGCAVKKALEEERISPLRYHSYCALIADLSEAHEHR